MVGSTMKPQMVVAGAQDREMRQAGHTAAVTHPVAKRESP